MTTITLPDWTKDAPTKPGLYRFRGECLGYWSGKVETPVWCEVWFSVNPRVGQVWLMGRDWPALLAKMEGRWQGPVRVEDAP